MLKPKYIPRGWDDRKLLDFLESHESLKSNEILERFNIDAKQLYKLRKDWYIPVKVIKVKTGKPGRKKGIRPHNYKKPGHQFTDKKGVVYLKLDDGKYVIKARHVWQQKHGGIPDKHVIRHKDGDKSNCRLSNLYLQSRRDAMEESNKKRKTKKKSR